MKSNFSENYKLIFPIVTVGLLFNAYVLFGSGIVSKELPAHLLLYIGTYFFGVVVPYWIIISKAAHALNFNTVLFWSILGTASSIYWCYAFLPITASEKVLLLPLSYISLWISSLFTLPIKKKNLEPGSPNLPD